VRAAWVSPSAVQLENSKKATARRAAVPLYGAVIPMAGGQRLTLKAAQIMLGIRDVDDPAGLREAFFAFWHWGNLRAVCQDLAFVA
jgi:hypothetical protein